MRKSRSDALLHNYIKEIKASLTCPVDEQKQVLASLEESVSTYLQDFPNATFDDITHRFGTPAQVVDAFLDEQKVSCIRSKNSLRKKIMASVLIIAAMAALVLGAIYVIDMHGFFHGHYNDTVAYGTPPPPESNVREY